MKNDFFDSADYIRCEEKCALEWVECMENEEGAYICKTLENNCYEDCSQG